MKLSPDDNIYWQYDFIVINSTLVWTWVIIIVLAVTAKLITRNLRSDIHVSRWQAALEIIITGINSQIKEVGLKDSGLYIGFLGTLFLFIAFSNLAIIFPFYVPPTSSLSTTAALAICVFIAVPFYGIMAGGVWNYLKSYLQPTFLMLPFNIIGEISRTFAMAVRLFGNMMSGTVIVGILLSIAPLIFPILLNALGLITGFVQAYIFSILATVYIAAASRESKALKDKKMMNT